MDRWREGWRLRGRGGSWKSSRVRSHQYVSSAVRKSSELFYNGVLASENIRPYQLYVVYDWSTDERRERTFVKVTRDWRPFNGVFTIFCYSRAEYVTIRCFYRYQPARNETRVTTNEFLNASFAEVCQFPWTFFHFSSSFAFRATFKV